MACPASVPLSRGCEDEESEHAALGTAAHTLGEWCLELSAREPWHAIGSKIGEFTVDKDMADAVAVYVDAVREWHPVSERRQDNFFVERKFHCPSIHEFFYGTSDCCFIDFPASTLHVWDYKHGAGIVVEVEDNPQLKYYGCGVLEDLGLWDEIDTVVMHVAQPRGWHSDGPIRQWRVSTDDLARWLEDVLVPAMDRALDAGTRVTESGEHCRFCPARSYACPQLMADMEELEALVAKAEKMEKGAEELTNAEVGRLLELHQRAGIVKKAAERTAFNRLQAGKEIPGFKLAAKRANREWKESAEDALKKKFGKKAYTEPALKSPAQIDALPGGEALTARHAFKPDTGLAVVSAKDARPGVNKDVKSLFTPQSKKRKSS